MISLSVRAAALAAVLSAVAAIPAEAQLASPIRFHVRGGAAVPTGDLVDGLKTGFIVGGGLTLRAPLLPVALRVDGDYTDMGADGAEGGVSIWSLNGNAQVSPTLLPVYVIGGAGFYGLDNGETSSTKFGLNGGVGVRLPLLVVNPFVEARYHHVFADAETFGGSWSYVPITVGIEF